MSMSKKHFEALAAMLNRTRPFTGLTGDPNGSLANHWRENVYSVADVCARFNPHFDRARFLKACGVEEAK